MKVKRPLLEMQEAASEVVEILRPFCRRIEVAGSIRRQKETVGDIEIVAIPILAGDMFGFVDKANPYLLDDLLSVGDKIALARREDGKFAANGKKQKKLMFGEYPVDLFLQPDPETWGVNFLVRTGSAEFVQSMMTPRTFGGLKPPYIQSMEARIYVRGKAVSSPEEGDVFAAWGLPFVDPPLRSLVDGVELWRSVVDDA